MILIQGSFLFLPYYQNKVLVPDCWGSIFLPLFKLSPANLLCFPVKFHLLDPRLSQREAGFCTKFNLVIIISLFLVKKLNHAALNCHLCLNLAPNLDSVAACQVTAPRQGGSHFWWNFYSDLFSHFHSKRFFNRIGSWRLFYSKEEQQMCYSWDIFYMISKILNIYGSRVKDL